MTIQELLTVLNVVENKQATIRVNDLGDEQNLGKFTDREILGFAELNGVYYIDFDGDKTKE